MELLHSTDWVILAFSAVLSINAFFISRLVRKIDKIDDIDNKISTYHAQYHEQIKGIQFQIAQISGQIQDVRDLRADVAVLKSIYNKKNVRNR